MADKAIRICKLYEIEKDLREKDLSHQDFLKKRRKLAYPVLKGLTAWLATRSTTVLPNSLLSRGYGTVIPAISLAAERHPPSTWVLTKYS